VSNCIARTSHTALLEFCSYRLEYSSRVEMVCNNSYHNKTHHHDAKPQNEHGVTNEKLDFSEKQNHQYCHAMRGALWFTPCYFLMAQADTFRWLIALFNLKVTFGLMQGSLNVFVKGLHQMLHNISRAGHLT